jgi:4-amino-4-deoxy-L-arabinose transferase-like glycosyltransferase
VALAALLRGAGLGAMADDPFYDGAARTMGRSWHAFATGAIDPAATVALDKPPGYGWLQVAATRLGGFGTLALHLPAAVAGVVAVVALLAALRVLFGPAPALAGAAALAVLPVAVITARSDTMDAIVAALDCLALAAVAVAIRGGRPGWLLAAGLALGLTFEVKPFEGLVAAPGLAVAALAGLGLRRLPWVAAAAGVAAVAALAWLVALPALGGPHRPWAFGSSDGSAWNATLVYDGIGRLGEHARAHATAASLARVPAPPGPLRLASGRDGLRLRVGLELAGALLAAVLARPRGRVERAGWWGLLAWLATGVLLASAQGGLRPRYLEGVDPAIAAVLGVGAVLTGRRLVLAGAAAVLAASLAVSVVAVVHRTEDSGVLGALPAPRLAALDGWLGGRGVAVAAVSRGAQLVAHGDRRVTFLAAGPHPLVTAAGLRADVASGRVGAALLGSACARAGRGCTGAERWARDHGTPAPALGPGVLALSGGTPRGTRTSAASRRTARPGRPPRASRAARPPRGRGRPACRPRSASSAARARHGRSRVRPAPRCSGPAAATGRGTTRRRP